MTCADVMVSIMCLPTGGSGIGPTGSFDGLEQVAAQTLSKAVRTLAGNSSTKKSGSIYSGDTAPQNLLQSTMIT